MDRTNPHLAILIFIVILIGAFVFAVISYNRARITITFTSPHEDVLVYMDGQMMGKTPITIKNVSFGFRKFAFQKEGFKSREFIYDCKPKIDYSREIFLSDNSLQRVILETDSIKFAVPAVHNEGIYITLGSDGVIESFDDQYDKILNINLQDTILKPALLSTNLIIVGTFNGCLYAINKTDGSILWSLQLEKNVTPLFLENDIIWVLTEGGNLYQISIQGKVISREVFTEKILDKSFTVLGNKLYLITVDGRLVTKDNSGWSSTKLKIKGKVTHGIVTAERVYILTSFGNIYAFSHEGENVFLIEQRYEFSSKMKEAGGKLIVTVGKDFYIIDVKNGDIAFKRTLPEEINEIFIADEKIILGGKNRFLFFFDLAGNFITCKDMESEICGISYLNNFEFLITTKENVSIIKKPGI